MSKPKKIILIDDDTSNNLICKIIVSKALEGVSMIDFTNPVNSLEYIKNEFAMNLEPTIVFLDINMPEMTGWEVMEELSTYPQNIIDSLKIFILSSSVDNNDFEKASKDSRIIAYLTKPLMASKLKEVYEAL